MMAAAPTIVQIDLPEPTPPQKRTWRQRLARGAITVVIIIAVVSVFILAMLTPWLCYSIASITLLGAPTAIIVIMLRRAQRIRRMLRTLPAPGSSPADLATAFHPWCDVPNEGAILRKVVRELVRRGHRNLVLVLKYPDTKLDLAPLEIPFEPVETGRLYETIGALTDHEAEEKPPAEPRFGLTLPPRTIFQRVKAAIRGAPLVVFQLALLIGLPLFGAYQLYRAIAKMIRTGQPDFCLLVLVAVLLAMILLALVNHFFRSSQTLLAPAAIIRQRGRWYRSHHELHVLVPENSVFLALMDPFGPPDEFEDEDHASYMTWWASDGEELASGFSDRLLLRAWLSPLPPPTLDQLTDFI